MKLIISHSRTKRQIDGPFEICGTREDIESLATQIVSHLSDTHWSYGWIRIYERGIEPLSTTPPVPWDNDA